MGDIGQKAIDISRGKNKNKGRKARKEMRARDALPVLPDEEEIKKNRFRELAKRFTGRAATILTRRTGGARRGGSGGGGSNRSSSSRTPLNRSRYSPR